MRVLVRHQTGDIDLGELDIVPGPGDRIRLEGTDVRYAESFAVGHREWTRGWDGWTIVLLRPEDADSPGDG